MKNGFVQSAVMFTKGKKLPTLAPSAVQTAANLRRQKPVLPI